MLKISFKYFKYNKKQSFTIILGIALASLLLFSVSILFSSFREYLIDKALLENDYHVKIKGEILRDDNVIFLKEKDGISYIKYDDILKTYENTEKLCHVNSCDEIYYNNKLLSLYGIGDNNYLELFKSLIIGILFILSLAVFFIIYNSFLIGFTKKKNDIFLLLASGANKGQVGSIFFIEEIFCALIGIIVGFVLSLILNQFIIFFLNKFLYEFLNGKLEFFIYFPFMFLSLFFIMILVLFSSLIPLFKIRGYKVLGVIKDKCNFFSLKHFNIFSYALVNYKRSERKYLGLIISIFILCLVLNSLMIFSHYMSDVFDKFVHLPNYDVALISDEEDYSKLKDVSNFLEAKKVSVFKACEQKTAILPKYYNKNYQKTSNLFITNLGKGEIINKVFDTVLKDDKMFLSSYRPFNGLNNISVLGQNLKISLTEKVPFGFENMLLEGNYVLNLNNDDFNLVCPKFEGRAFIKTDKKGLDKLISDYALKNDLKSLSYINVKKGYEFINNVILVVRLFMMFFTFIICLILILSIFNVTSANILFRKREFATLKSLGFTNLKMNFCLCLESLFISFKGVFFAFPFILIISKYLYENFSLFFDLSFKVIDYGVFIFSFVFSFILIFISMILCHLNVYRASLISNIKDDKF